jgi:cytochrome b involved in lipid metabolism
VLLAVGLLFLLWTVFSSLGSSSSSKKKAARDEGEVHTDKPDEPKKCPDTYYTAADVAGHSTCHFGKGDFDLWLVIGDHVYDVTHWAPHHPGGSMICSGIGIDATIMFQSNHRDYVATEDLPKWCVGRIEAEEILKLKKKP